MLENQDFSGSTVAAILGAVSLIVTAIGVPEIMKNWKAIREMKYGELNNKLNDTKVQLTEVKRDLWETKDQLKKVSTIVSIVIPMMKLKSKDDPEIMELIRIFERESGINLTPEGYEGK